MSLDLPDYNLNLAYCAKGQAWIMFAFLNDLTEKGKSSSTKVKTSIVNCSTIELLSNVNGIVSY